MTLQSFVASLLITAVTAVPCDEAKARLDEEMGDLKALVNNHS